MNMFLGLMDIVRYCKNCAQFSVYILYFFVFPVVVVWNTRTVCASLSCHVFVIRHCWCVYFTGFYISICCSFL